MNPFSPRFTGHFQHASGACRDASRERRGSDAGYDSLDAVD